MPGILLHHLLHFMPELLRRGNPVPCARHERPQKLLRPPDIHRDRMPPDAHRRGTGLVSVDNEIHITPEPVCVGMNPLLTGGLDLPLVTAVLDPAPDQIPGPETFIRHTAWGDDEFAVGDPGADVAPGPGGQPLLHQPDAGVHHKPSGLFFCITHFCSSVFFRSFAVGCGRLRSSRSAAEFPVGHGFAVEIIVPGRHGRLRST